MTRPGDDAAARFPPGAEPLDHTADIGLRLEAASLTDLFHTAAAGLTAFLVDPDAPAENADAPQAERTEEIGLEEPDTAMLLAAWLRELLFLTQSTGLCYVGAEFLELEANRLRARVRLGPPAGSLREIKGVTYHGLEAAPTPRGWQAQVIFDV